MTLERIQVPTADGWRIRLSRVVPGGGGPPVLLVPGYAMNSFILGFHPGGQSLMGWLKASGLDVWAVDMRGQEGATGKDRHRIGLAEQALIDLPTALRHVADLTGQPRVHLIGCSLGGSLAYALLAHDPAAPVDKVVAIGSPLRWRQPSAFIRAFAAAGPLLGRIPMRGTRQAARVALPVAARAAPALLGMYMNAGNIDLGQPQELVKTVEDPIPRLNRQVAAWIRQGELVVAGVPVGERLRRVERPLLVVTGSGDGIAPEDACRSVLDVWGGPVKTLQVGDSGDRWAHADLFIGRDASRRVFEPMSEFLAP